MRVTLTVAAFGVSRLTLAFLVTPQSLLLASRLDLISSHKQLKTNKFVKHLSHCAALPGDR